MIALRVLEPEFDEKQDDVDDNSLNRFSMPLLRAVLEFKQIDLNRDGEPPSRYPPARTLTREIDGMPTTIDIDSNGALLMNLLVGNRRVLQSG